MPIVESKQPNGGTRPVYEVVLTASGLLIEISDESGRGFRIDRFAWEGIVAAVAAEYARSEAEAREWTAAHYVEGD